MKLNLRGRLIAADCLSTSIRAASSLSARCLASSLLSFLTLISSALAWRLTLTLTASSKTSLYSSIMAL